ncbi:MAG: HemK2/MTQ2 family protein methyltransferase [Promethearchaeota archaeon]
MNPVEASFSDVRVVVHDGVYEPAEDTLMLCEYLDIIPGETMLEIGCGCGLVSIVAARNGAAVVATDKSLAAVQNTRENARRNALLDKIDVRQGQLFEPIREEERFALIVINPPYLPGTREDPAYDNAWSGGLDGREVIDAFLAQCTNFLENDGRVLLVQSSLSNTDKTQKALDTLFHSSTIKAEKRFFYERLLLFEAQRPRQATY